MRPKPRVDVTLLLPHGEQARFVTEVVVLDDRELVCVGRVPAESSFARGGVVPGFVLLELAAQAAATEVLARMDRGAPRPRVGYLARAHGLSWTAKGVPADAPLTARVRRAESIPPLYGFTSTVTLDGAEVFGGRFSIYVGERADGI